MRRLLSLSCVLVLLLAGCSLIVDFDRSKLDDGGVDIGLDGSFDGGVIPFDDEEEAPAESDVDAG